MRRSTTKQDKVCPSCKKVVEYGVVCDSCNSFFHATEACCGDGLADAFTSSRQGAWNCTNCLPKQGKPRENDLSAERRCAAAEVELVEWRRAFRILTDACASCGIRVAGGDAPPLRCAECCLQFHADRRCTGLSAEALERATGLGDAWRCPTCMLRATGATVADGRVLDDVSGGLEDMPIPLVNEVDGGGLVLTEGGVSPDVGFTYVREVVWNHPRALEQRSSLPVADWGGVCIAAEACAYLPASDGSGGKPVRRTGSDAGGAAYNRDGCLFFARDTIFECNATCSCDPLTCPNRTVGRGIKARLQVFKTPNGRGFGVRCMHPLPAGSFVCEYTGDDAHRRPPPDAPPARDRETARPPPPLTAQPAAAAGEMLLDSDADAAGIEVDDSYLFNLDGESKGQVSKRKKTGDKGTQASKTAQTETNPEMCVNASHTGSVARFLNHCCEPNLFVQSVFVEYSRHVHRIALFTARDILPYEELTYDYGYVLGSVEGKSLKCLCGARACRGFLF